MEKSCLIKLASTQMKEEYELLLSHLIIPSDHMRDINNSNNNMTVINNMQENSVRELEATFPPINYDDNNIATIPKITATLTFRSNKQL